MSEVATAGFRHASPRAVVRSGALVAGLVALVAVCC